MTEFQELTQDAPNFVSMERGELVAYAYGMFAAGTKANAENTKLREEFDKMDVWHSKELTAAIDENAKLRELVVILMACLSVDDCDKCPINGAEFKVSEVRCCYAAKQRMRELGVEVDE